MMFQCQHLSKDYQTREGLVQALDDVNFSANKEEFICLVGSSGCGKTTLLKLIAGLEKPTSGRITFHDDPPHGYHHVAMVFQEHGLFPWMTVLDNVAFGLETRGVGRQERHEQARTFIQKVGLDRFTYNFPHELSVGMRQRVGIARAFLADPQMLLMDEPFGSLDTQTKLVLQEELLRIWVEYRKTIIYVTHDIGEAVLLGDRVLVMTAHPGRIREEIHIPLSRPRDISNVERPEISEIKWHIWKILEDEVKRSLLSFP